MSELRNTITNINTMPSTKGSSVGYGTFMVAGLFNVRFTIMRNNSTQEKFVSLPSIKIQKGGENRWINQIDFPKDGAQGKDKKALQDELSAIILEEFNKKHGNNAGAQANQNSQANFQNQGTQSGSEGGGQNWDNYNYTP